MTMNGVIIAAIVCVTVIILSWMDKSDKEGHDDD